MSRIKLFFGMIIALASSAVAAVSMVLNPVTAGAPTRAVHRNDDLDPLTAGGALSDADRRTDNVIALDFDRRQRPLPHLGGALATSLVDDPLLDGSVNMMETVAFDDSNETIVTLGSGARHRRSGTSMITYEPGGTPRRDPGAGAFGTLDPVPIAA